MPGYKNYGSNYGGSHPGDSIAFIVVIVLILGGALVAYASSLGQ